MSDGTRPEPWFKQFWPWFLIALPGSVVIASAITLYLAAQQPLEVNPTYGGRVAMVVPTPDEAAATTSFAPQEIQLERIDADDWRLTYRLPAPSDALRFARPAQFFRETQWRVLTPGWRFERDGDSQTLVGDTATDIIVIEMNAYSEVMRAEYRAFQPFSDGATAIYTGHLYLRSIASEAAFDEPDDAPHLVNIRATPPAGTTAVVLGEVYDDTFTWTDPYAAGTYLYFGDQPPQVSEHLTAIVDPGLPGWLRRRAAAMFPQMFDALAAGFDEPLPWHPTVVIAWEEGDAGARNWSGGALPGQIRMSLQGGGWETEGAANTAELARFIAHEAAHFWNNQIISYIDRNQSWMHEGGADAVAELLLRRLGLIDDDGLRASREVAINRCLTALDGASLNGAAARERFGDYYPCGHLMAVWAEAALQLQDDEYDLFTLWSTLIDRVGSEGEYDQQGYLETLASLGVAQTVTAAMARFADEDLADQRESVVDGFAEVGLELRAEADARPPMGIRLDQLRTAVAHLMASNCGGGYSYSSYPSHMRIYPVGDCDAFQVEADILGIAGEVYADGDLIHAAVVQSCATGGEIGFDDAQGETVLQVRCNTALAAQAPWLTLSND